jgi:hypothetical protein
MLCRFSQRFPDITFVSGIGEGTHGVFSPIGLNKAMGAKTHGFFRFLEAMENPWLFVF